jgi:hypothetical protein
MKNRIKTKLTRIDWAALLTQIQLNGLNSDAVAELTSISPSFVRNIAGDRQPAPAAWNDAIALLDIYMMITDNQPVPLIK